jgi:hypothetical protein
LNESKVEKENYRAKMIALQSKDPGGGNGEKEVAWRTACMPARTMTAIIRAGIDI